jgi:hypothetical protein
MKRKFMVAVVAAVVLGLISCRKDGASELTRSVDAMKGLRSFRMTSSLDSGPSGTAEFVCPDRFHSIEKRGDDDYEQLVIGTQAFTKQGSGGWIQYPKPARDASTCLAPFGPFAAEGTSDVAKRVALNYLFKEIKYLREDTVDGTTCDSWVAKMPTYGRPAPGQYVPPPKDVDPLDYVVCINPKNHMILQIKRDRQVSRFYDFYQDIRISEPETSSLNQTN